MRVVECDGRKHEKKLRHEFILLIRREMMKKSGEMRIIRRHNRQ